MDEARFYATMLAKQGYYGGNPENLMQAPVNEVFQLIKFEQADADYLACLKKLREK